MLSYMYTVSIEVCVNLIITLMPLTNYVDDSKVIALLATN